MLATTRAARCSPAHMWPASWWQLGWPRLLTCRLHVTTLAPPRAASLHRLSHPRRHLSRRPTRDHPPHPPPMPSARRLPPFHARRWPRLLLFSSVRPGRCRHATRLASCYASLQDRQRRWAARRKAQPSASRRRGVPVHRHALPLGWKTAHAMRRAFRVAIHYILRSVPTSSPGTSPSQWEYFARATEAASSACKEAHLDLEEHLRATSTADDSDSSQASWAAGTPAPTETPSRPGTPGAW